MLSVLGMIQRFFRMKLIVCSCSLVLMLASTLSAQDLEGDFKKRLQELWEDRNLEGLMGLLYPVQSSAPQDMWNGDIEEAFVKSFDRKMTFVHLLSFRSNHSNWRYRKDGVVWEPALEPFKYVSISFDEEDGRFFSNTLNFYLGKKDGKIYILSDVPSEGPPERDRVEVEVRASDQ